MEAKGATEARRGGKATGQADVHDAMWRFTQQPASMI